MHYKLRAHPLGGRIIIGAWTTLFNGTYFIGIVINQLHGAVLLEKLRVHSVKNFPFFYGTKRFITMFTRSHHWSLSSAI
jgi:hypothetical protein